MSASTESKPPPSTTRMTPSEAFVETLRAYGVRDVFGIVGSALMDALDLFPAAGIRYVPTVHEQGAGHMADGYARASDLLLYRIRIRFTGVSETRIAPAI